MNREQTFIAFNYIYHGYFGELDLDSVAMHLLKMSSML